MKTSQIESKSQDNVKIHENYHIDTVEDYIFYFETLDSKELINKIFEKEKVINNFNIKIYEESNLEILRFKLIGYIVFYTLRRSLSILRGYIWVEILVFQDPGLPNPDY